jgi:hypothetical protein
VSRRQYVALASTMPLEWLIECAAHPSTRMTNAHVRLLRVAIRRRKHGSR